VQWPRQLQSGEKNNNKKQRKQKNNKSKYTNRPSTDNNITTHPNPVPRSPTPNDGDGREENLAVSGAEVKSSYYL